MFSYAHRAPTHRRARPSRRARLAGRTRALRAVRLRASRHRRLRRRSSCRATSPPSARARLGASAPSPGSCCRSPPIVHLASTGDLARGAAHLPVRAGAAGAHRHRRRGTVAGAQPRLAVAAAARGGDFRLLVAAALRQPARRSPCMLALAAGQSAGWIGDAPTHEPRRGGDARRAIRRLCDVAPVGRAPAAQAPPARRRRQFASVTWCSPNAIGDLVMRHDADGDVVATSGDASGAVRPRRREPDRPRLLRPRSTSPIAPPISARCARRPTAMRRPS